MAEAKKTTKKVVNATEVKSVDDLKKDLAAKRKDLMDSIRSHRAGELINPRILGQTRKEIARLATAIRAAELAVQKESK
jgi:ribosomal protein L29